jgi:hypothetical protein
LPDDLLERLQDRQEIAAIARQFADAVVPRGTTR